MYNGIGLETARGSGTNGYVQRNMAFVRPRKDKVSYKTEEEIAKSEALLNREPNLEILEHERKRKIELKCMELQELMEDQGYDQDAIEQKVDAFRQKLVEKDSSEKPQITLDESGRPIATGTHQIAAASMDRNKKLREAFGISADYVDGSSMDPLRKQKEIDARAAAKLKYNIIKDPEDDLPPVKVTNLKSDALKDPLPDVVSSVKNSDKSRKSDRSDTRKARSSPPEEGEVSQEDDRRTDRKKKSRDNSDRQNRDRRASADYRKKKRQRSPSTSSGSSGSESDTEGSDSEVDHRKADKARQGAPKRPLQESHRSHERKRESPLPEAKRPSSPDRKRKVVLDRRRQASPEPERKRPASPKRQRSPPKRERDFTPERKRRSPSPRRPSRASPDRRRPLSSDRSRRQVSPVRTRKVTGGSQAKRSSPERKKSPAPKLRRDRRSASSSSSSDSSPERNSKNKDSRVKRRDRSPAAKRSSSSSSSSDSSKSPVRRRSSPRSPQARRTDDARKTGRRS